MKVQRGGPEEEGERLFVFVRIKGLRCLETSEIIEQSTQLNIPKDTLTHNFVKISKIRIVW